MILVALMKWWNHFVIVHLFQMWKISWLFVCLLLRKVINFINFGAEQWSPGTYPALITYANGYTIGARLDRNGFRPCRWVRTQDHFYLSSEAGTFEMDESTIEGKGTLYAGRGVTVDLANGDKVVPRP